jgi:hypothetical protein
MVLGSHLLQGVQLMMGEVGVVEGITGEGAKFLGTTEHSLRAKMFFVT